MKRYKSILTAAGALALAGAVTIQPVQAEELVVVSTGGNFGEALNDNFFTPFSAKTGIEIIHVPLSTSKANAKLRTMHETGSVEYDVITVTPEISIRDADIVADLDCDRIPNAAALGVDGTCTGKYLLRTIGAQVLAYNKDNFPNGGPTSFADYWDTENFPGPRCLSGENIHNHWPLITALLADGVHRDDVFPMDLDRAIAKLHKIKDDVGAYWTSGSQSQDLMRTVMSTMWSGRALSLRNEGVPIGVVWDSAITDVGAWGIAEGANNLDGAYAFLNFFLERPEAHKAFSEKIPYATPNKDVLGLLSEEVQMDFSTSPANYDLLTKVDYQWVADNFDDIRTRYAEFLNE